MERLPDLQILISGVMFSSSAVNGGGVKDVLPGFAYMCGRCDGFGD
jgi:nickel-dependent lactate racemase